MDSDSVDWQGIKAAYDFVAGGSADRVDGKGWKVYRAGSIIRVDLDA